MKVSRTEFLTCSWQATFAQGWESGLQLVRWTTDCKDHTVTMIKAYKIATRHRLHTTLVSLLLLVSGHTLPFAICEGCSVECVNLRGVLTPKNYKLLCNAKQKATIITGMTGSISWFQCTKFMHAVWAFLPVLQLLFWVVLMSKALMVGNTFNNMYVVICSLYPPRAPIRVPGGHTKDVVKAGDQSGSHFSPVRVEVIVLKPMWCLFHPWTIIFGPLMSPSSCLTLLVLWCFASFRPIARAYKV